MIKLCLAVILLCAGCATSPITDVKKTLNVDGVVYTLIRPASTNKLGIVNVELYAKPGNENSYYTRSLDGNGMVSIAR